MRRWRRRDHCHACMAESQVLLDYVFKCRDEESPPLTTLVPNESTSEIYLPLNKLDYSKESKNGCGGI